MILVYYFSLKLFEGSVYITHFSLHVIIIRKTEDPRLSRYNNLFHNWSFVST